MWPEEANDICAGDQMPEDWDWIEFKDIWRGMQKGEKRPAIDLFLVKQMLEFKDRSAEIRYGQDREANGGGASLFLLNEFKQEYIVMHFKHPNGPPDSFLQTLQMRMLEPQPHFFHQAFGQTHKWALQVAKAME